ncbi:MAG: helix-turn-helix domain-containing protein [Bacteroidetes bacterium]|jgi:hypothetical protein|nr:helix-turn-helix domain-containing protein [Bacteroidota bacterium]
MPTIVTDAEDLREIIREEAAAAVQLAKERTPAPAGRKEYLTNTEAQKYLDVSASTLARYRDAGKLSYSKMGRFVFYKRADVVAMLDAAHITKNGASTELGS